MLKKYTLFLFLMMAFVFYSNSIFAQNAEPQTIDTKAETKVARRGLLTMLNLTPEQMKKVRLINRERQARIQVNQARFRNANIALEEAMYADNLDESLIRARSAEVEAAQTEIFRTRIYYEMAVRRILNPDQLAKFRDLRQANMPRLQPNKKEFRRENLIRNRRDVSRQ